MLLFNENPDLREYYVEAHGNDISKLSVKRKKKKKKWNHWNALPESVVCLPTVDAFKEEVGKLHHSRL